MSSSPGPVSDCEHPIDEPFTPPNLFRGRDTRVVASNYAFKPTAGEVFRTNQPLLTGGGLTRR
jgi:hypothetical protein